VAALQHHHPSLGYGVAHGPGCLGQVEAFTGLATPWLWPCPPARAKQAEEAATRRLRVNRPNAMRRIKASFQTGPTMIGLAYLGLTREAIKNRIRSGRRNLIGVQKHQSLSQ
jgi:hypothetical protein